MNTSKINELTAALKQALRESTHNHLWQTRVCVIDHKVEDTPSIGGTSSTKIVSPIFGVEIYSAPKVEVVGIMDLEDSEYQEYIDGFSKALLWRDVIFNMFLEDPLLEFKDIEPLFAEALFVEREDCRKTGLSYKETTAELNKYKRTVKGGNKMLRNFWKEVREARKAQYKS